MMRTALLLIAGLAAIPVAVQDIDGHRLSVLSPPEHQLEVLFFISSDCPISNRYAPEIQRVCNDDLYVDVGRTRRAPTRRDLRLALDAVLAGQSITPPETDAVGCFIQKP